MVFTFCSAHVQCKCSMIMHVTSTSGNDTHCQLLSLRIIPAHRPCTMLYYMHKQHIFICAPQHALAYKLTYGRCDMHMLSILIYDKLICCDSPARRAGTNASVLYTCKHCSLTVLIRLWWVLLSVCFHAQALLIM